MFALAQSGSTEVEAQHGKAKAVQRLHGVEDDFVVQRSAKQRMGMTDQRSMRRVLGSGVEQSFESSGGTVEKQGADGGVRRNHSLRLHGEARWRRNPARHRKVVKPE